MAATCCDEVAGRSPSSDMPPPTPYSREMGARGIGCENPAAALQQGCLYLAPSQYRVPCPSMPLNLHPRCHSPPSLPPHTVLDLRDLPAVSPTYCSSMSFFSMSFGTSKPSTLLASLKKLKALFCSSFWPKPTWGEGGGGSSSAWMFSSPCWLNLPGGKGDGGKVGGEGQWQSKGRRGSQCGAHSWHYLPDDGSQVRYSCQS